MNKSALFVRDLSLIASLAAFAILGRILFAPFPNFKPMSSMIIICGAVFGPRIGFGVAICATLGSNVFFGHGPWTIWQLIAWGFMGLASGWVGNLLLRSKFVLISWGFLFGFLFGMIMNVYMWLAFYPHTWLAWGIVQLQSFSFDLAHAISNVIFLLVGLPLLKPLLRFQVKRVSLMTVRSFMIFLIGTTLLISNTAFPFSITQRAFAEQLSDPIISSESELQLKIKSSINAAKDWLKKVPITQRDEWYLLALAFSGQEYENHHSKSASWVFSPNTSTTDVARTVFAMLGSQTIQKLNPSMTLQGTTISVSEKNLQTLIWALQDSQQANGKFSDTVALGGSKLTNAHLFSLLALLSSNAKDFDLKGAIDYLRHQQLEHGAFDWIEKSSNKPSQGDADMTAFALITAKLAKLDFSDPLVSNAFDRLKKWQNDQSGGLLPVKLENTETNAVLIQSLIAWGIDPYQWGKSNSTTNPVVALLAFQKPDGSFSHFKNGPSNTMATVQALFALQSLEENKTVYEWLANAHTTNLYNLPLSKDIASTHPAAHIVQRMLAWNWMPLDSKTNLWLPNQKMSEKAWNTIYLAIQSKFPDTKKQKLLSTKKSVTQKQVITDLNRISQIKLKSTSPTQTFTKLSLARFLNDWITKQK